MASDREVDLQIDGGARVLRFAVDGSGRQLALIDAGEDTADNTFHRRRRRLISILIESGRQAATIVEGAGAPFRCLVAALPRRLRGAAVRLAEFRSALAGVLCDMREAAREGGGGDETAADAAWFDAVGSRALLPFEPLPPIGGEAAERSFWCEDSDDVVVAWARAALLGADPLVPGLEGRPADRLPLDAGLHIRLLGRSSSGSVATELVRLRLELCGGGSGAGSHCVSRPAFVAILYWTPQMLAALRSADGATCVGLAANLRVEWPGASHANEEVPGPAEPRLLVDAFRFRADKEGLFRFRRTPAAATASVMYVDSCELDALRLLVHSGHCRDAATAAAAASVSAPLDAGLLADGHSHSLRWQLVQSITAGGALRRAAWSAAHLVAHGAEVGAMAQEGLRVRAAEASASAEPSSVLFGPGTITASFATRDYSNLHSSSESPSEGRSGDREGLVAPLAPEEPRFFLPSARPPAPSARLPFLRKEVSEALQRELGLLEDGGAARQRRKEEVRERVVAHALLKSRVTLAILQ